MLQAAITIAHRHHQEQIALDGRLPVLGVEHRDLRLADRLQVAYQPFEVHRGPARDHDLVPAATCIEMRKLEVPHLHRVIDQCVIVRCPEAPELVQGVRGPFGASRTTRRHLGARQRRCHLPVSEGLPVGREDVYRTWVVFLPLHAQEHAAAIEEPMRRIQMGCPHGQIPRIDLIADHQAQPRIRQRIT